jgi:hypothetical protein
MAKEFNARLIVGEFFEEKLIRLFDLIRIDKKSGEIPGKVPDLISRNNSFYIEVKASAYNNGGVIKGEQLFKFEREIEKRRFYAFAYHSIKKSMHKNYRSEKELRKALDLRSLYIFPFSIVKAHYDYSTKYNYIDRGLYAQLNESEAEKIFLGNSETWINLKLNKEKYIPAKLHETINIMTREGYLEKSLRDSFNPEALNQVYLNYCKKDISH